MNYLSITHCDQVNGSGNRVVLWVSGCSHKCDRCHSMFSWDHTAGLAFDQAAKDELFEDLAQDWCAGITYSGGDPMFEVNRETILQLAREIHEKLPDKTQWLYTGYTWDELVNDNEMRRILQYIDVVCDGPYIKELRDIDKPWVGSSNQNVIDVKQRLNVVSSLNSARLAANGENI